MNKKDSFISFRELSDAELIDFLHAWGRLSRPTQEIILYMLRTRPYPFVGTFTALSYAMNKNTGYIAETSRVCNWLEDKGILDITPCDKKYNKKIAISSHWVTQIVKLAHAKIIAPENYDLLKRIGTHNEN